MPPLTSPNPQNHFLNENRVTLEQIVIGLLVDGGIFHLDLGEGGQQFLLNFRSQQSGIVVLLGHLGLGIFYLFLGPVLVGFDRNGLWLFGLCHDC